MSSPDSSDYAAELDRLVSGALEMFQQDIRVDAPAEAAPVSAGGHSGPFHAAAAVLSTFDRSSLQPLPGDSPESPSDDLYDLLADSTPLQDAHGRPRWKLLSDVRRAQLKRLGDADTIQRALEANPERPLDDPVQSVFEAYVNGSAPPLHEQDATQLAATFEVAQWLQGLDVALRLKVPDVDAIRARTDYLSLLHPFEELAGRNFAGRKTELKRLRNYVGVVPPRSLVGRTVRAVREAAREVFSLTDKPPLVVHGPGGVGKSALIARLIWEHATVSEEDRFPFVYLDFDRVTLRPEEPLTLLIEAVRQIALEYEEARTYAERVRESWQEQLLARYRTTGHSGVDATTAEASREEDWLSWVGDVASLLKNVREGRDPCLFALDTFEVVQHRGEAVVSSLCDFLRVLQAAVPRLRIVVAGRAPVTVEGLKTDRLPLSDFDDDAAREFLAARRVTDPSLVKHITKHLGRSPLTLHLAATAIERARESGESEALDFKGVGGAKATEAQIQGILYRRILEHIRDEPIAKLAYPGLVLRRITPDIIRHVLASPCRVDVPDEATANNLFDRLSNEVSLVSFEDGALVHRRDVRQMIVRLLRDAEPDTVRRIEESAIAYYESCNSPVERAEEIYHRLARRQPLDVVAARWSDDVKPYLFSALDEDELGARERAWLLPKLDPERKLSEEEAAAADLETWEWNTQARVRDMLARDRFEDALETLRARAERSPGSPLYLLEAETLAHLERWTEARDVLVAGVNSAGEKGDINLVLDLLAQAAAVELRLGHYPAARALLDQTEDVLPDRRDAAPRALRLALTRAELARRGREDVDVVQIRRRFDCLTDEQLVTNPQLAAWAAAELGPGLPAVFERVLELLGLELWTRRLTSLASAIAQWDDERSRAAGRWKGVMGGERLPWAETLTAAWTQHLRDLGPRDAGRRIAELLRQGEPPDDVVTVLERAMVDGAGPLILRPATARPRRAPSRVTPKDADASVRLGGKQMAQLQDALINAFPSRSELGLMLRTRLDRSLDAISFQESHAETVLQLLQFSQAQGWTASLVAAAMESRPDNATLRAAAEATGIVAAAPPVGTSGEYHDAQVWRSRLGVIEAQVCRLGVGERAFGTAFLVGPDLMLTAAHVVARVLDGHLPPDSVTALFDFKALPDGRTVSVGTVYGLSERDWLVCASSELDYALLGLAETPGSDPIGGNRAEPGAPPRGWITPRQRSSALLPGSRLVILHHGRGGPLQVAVARESVIGLDDSGTWVRFQADTEPGATGAPCFDMNWDLVAVYSARDVNAGVGVSIAAIIRDIEAQGFGDVLFRATV